MLLHINLSVFVGSVFEQDDVDVLVISDEMDQSNYRIDDKKIIRVFVAHYESSVEPERKLISAINSALDVPHIYGVKKIAIPALGIGLKRYPILTAAKILVRTVQEYKFQPNDISEVRICVPTEGIRHLFQSEINKGNT